MFDRTRKFRKNKKALRSSFTIESNIKLCRIREYTRLAIARNFGRRFSPPNRFSVDGGTQIEMRDTLTPGRHMPRFARIRAKDPTDRTLSPPPRRRARLEIRAFAFTQAGSRRTRGTRTTTVAMTAPRAGCLVTARRVASRPSGVGCLTRSRATG